MESTWLKLPKGFADSISPFDDGVIASRDKIASEADRQILFSRNWEEVLPFPLRRPTIKISRAGYGRKVADVIC